MLKYNIIVSCQWTAEELAESLYRYQMNVKEYHGPEIFSSSVCGYCRGSQGGSGWASTGSKGRECVLNNLSLLVTEGVLVKSSYSVKT